MRRVLPILSALLLACVAGAPCAWAQAEDPPAPDTSSLVLPAPDAATVAAVVAANPGAALPLVASAVARDPAIAPDLVAKVIAALSGRNDADEAGRIAAAASSIAPALAPRIVGAAVGAASLAAGRAVKPYPGTTPSDAAQAALAASATAAATVAQAVIAAIGETTDAHVTADAAAAITREAVAASMTATATAASEAARAAGATPGEATALGAKAARLAAEMVTQAIIAAATTATQKAAASDASALAARTNASPEAAAATAAAAASLVADRVTRAAVAASGSAESASGVADAAQRQTSRSVSAVATTAASSAGASPEAAQRIGDRAGARSDGAADGVAGPALARPGGAPALGTETLSLSPASPADIARGSGSLLDHPERAVPAIFAMLAFVTVVGLALPWLQPDIFKSRLKLINERRGALSQQRKQRLEAERHSLRRLTSGREDFMRVVLEKLKVKNITEQPELRKKLVRAGYRSPQAAITLTFLRLALPLALAGVLALLLFGSGNVHIAPAFKVVIISLSVLVAYMLPDIMVSNAIARRRQEIQRKFPDAIDLMVICIESGISLEAAFARVSEEMAADAPALSEEIAITTAELAFLSDRRQALDNLAERTASPPIKSLVTSLIQSEKYGTPLGQALRVVAQEGRDTRLAAAEEKAAGLPAKLTVPMVTFFLPVLFLVLIGPTIIQVMRAFSGKG